MKHFNAFFDVYVALFIYITSIGVMLFMNGDKFAQGLVTGSMLTVTTLLRSVRSAPLKVNGNGTNGKPAGTVAAPEVANGQAK